MPGPIFKPSRSDEIIPPDEQSRIAEQIRRYFDSSAPKRPHKPDRSEFSEEPPLDQFLASSEIPEYLKFQALAAASQPLLSSSADCSSDEFVETDYYKDLNAVDRTLHFTTGTGYIQVEPNDGRKLNLNVTGLVRTRNGCNPAMNDWIPSPELVMPSSEKPHRSEP